MTDVYPVTLDPATKNLVTKTGLKVGVWTATYKIFETANPANSMTKIVTFTVFYDGDTYDTTATIRHQIMFSVDTDNTPLVSDAGAGLNTTNMTMTKLCGKDKDGNLMVFFDGTSDTSLKFENYHDMGSKLYSHYKNDASLDVNLVFSNKYIMVKRLRYSNDPYGVYRYVYNEDVSKIVSDTTTVTKPTLSLNGITGGSKIYWVKL